MRSIRDDVRAVFSDVEPDWRAYGRAVTERRSALGLTQEQLTAMGGPSTATLRLIEGALQDNYRSHTLYSLDRALGWSPGSHLSVLAGREPHVLVDAARFRETVPRGGERVVTEQNPRRAGEIDQSFVGEAVDAEYVPEGDRADAPDPALMAEIAQAAARLAELTQKLVPRDRRP